jgi:hypothetical protein
MPIISWEQACREAGHTEAQCRADDQRVDENIAAAKYWCSNLTTRVDRAYLDECQRECGISLTHGSVRECAANHANYADSLEEHHRDVFFASSVLVVFLAVVVVVAVRDIMRAKPWK